MIKSGPRESPYFCRQKRDLPASGCQSSPFFAQSPCSIVGSIRSLGSLLKCFLPSHQEAAEWDQLSCCCSYCCQSKTLTQHQLSRNIPEKEIQSHASADLDKSCDSSCCRCCRQAVLFDIILRHFDACPHFQKKWKSERQECFTKAPPATTDETTSAPSLSSSIGCCCTIQHLECLWHQSVRHLCTHGCYYKAYAPVREWHKLRQAVRLQDRDAMDAKLQGWQCRIVGGVPNQHTTTTRVAFIHPKGALVGGPSAVLKSLQKMNAETDNTDCSETSCTEQEERVTPKRRRIQSLFFKNNNTTRRSIGGSPCAQQKPLSQPSRIEHFTRRISHRASPLGLLEELFCDQPWHLLICTMFLNRTTRAQVDPVLAAFFARWPLPESIIAEIQGEEQQMRPNNTDTITVEQELARMLRPLGLYEKRAKGIIRFTQEYLNLVHEKKKQKDGLHMEQEWLLKQSKDRVSSTIAARKDQGRIHTSSSQAMVLTKDEILSLHQCGKYAAAACRLFILDDTDDLDCDDHALVAYAAYRRAIR